MICEAQWPRRSVPVPDSGFVSHSSMNLSYHESCSGVLEHPRHAALTPQPFRLFLQED